MFKKSEFKHPLKYHFGFKLDRYYCGYDDQIEILIVVTIVLNHKGIEYRYFKG